MATDIWRTKAKLILKFYDGMWTRYKSDNVRTKKVIIEIKNQILDNIHRFIATASLHVAVIS